MFNLLKKWSFQTKLLICKGKKTWSCQQCCKSKYYNAMLTKVTIAEQLIDYGGMWLLYVVEGGLHDRRGE